jgi:hypothetical protein
MKRRSLSDLKGDFLHIHKSNNKTGIISTLLSRNIQIGSGKIKDVHKELNNMYGKCNECDKKQIGGLSKPRKKMYIENQDLCYVGTRVKLVNPNLVRIGGKLVKFNYKTIVRRCNKHEHEELKHK